MEEDEDVAMELPAAVQAEEAPSLLVVEEEIVAEALVTEVAAVDIVGAATVVEEIAAVTAEVAIGAEVAVTEVAAAADGLLHRSTRRRLESLCPTLR